MAREKMMVDDPVDDLVLELVCLEVDGQLFGLPISQIKEITTLLHVCRVVHTADVIEGVINLRGEIICLIDLGVLLNPALKRGRVIDDGLMRLIIVEILGQTLAVRVGSVLASKRFDKGDVQHLEQEVAVGSDYYAGVVQLDGRPVTILDVEKILADERISCYG